ncbi:hypothetical protein NPIL_101251 [Nephila pilipes]|uniref:Uncharacterized protein n=1 Tax=Nephila pilipes TaxID=299642 RepID=A0A8X6NSA8_NEPPI|nr:hypothetical protein NPIL_101251 [Nephila pilipes]
MKDATSTASCCRIKGDDQGVEVTVRTSKVRLESSLRRSNKSNAFAASARLLVDFTLLQDSRRTSNKPERSFGHCGNRTCPVSSVNSEFDLKL